MVWRKGKESLRILVILLIPALLLNILPLHTLSETNTGESLPFNAPSGPSAIRSTLASNWHVETVDSEEYVGQYTSLALDQSGRPYVSYHVPGPPPWYTPRVGKGLRYARHDTTGWHIETLESTWGTHTSLALDEAGRPHISYHGGDLKYAWHDGRDWHIETVDNELWEGEYTSLALDGSGRPHISYHGYWPPPPVVPGAADESDWFEGYLRYAWHDGTDWHIETVDSGGWEVGRYTSLALDGSGRPHISYSSGGSLKYAWHDGTGWHIETVVSEGSSASLALDRSDRPHISYNSGGSLQYAWHDGAGWHIETVVSEGSSASLALDRSDRSSWSPG